MLFRFGNVGTRSQTTEGLNWRPTITVNQAPERIHSGMAYELFIRGESEDDVPLHEYGFQTTFRNPMFGAEPYGDWALGFRFQRDYPDDIRTASLRLGQTVLLPSGPHKKKNARA